MNTKVAVKGLQWLGCKDPAFNAGQTRTAKATLTNRTGEDLVCTTELYLDVMKVASSGVSSSFTIPAGGSIDVSYVVTMPTSAGGPYHVYIDVWSGGALLAHYQATEDVTVNPALLITTTSLPNGILGVAYSQTLAASGGSGTYTWSVVSGALPDGLTLSGNKISGTPTTVGAYTFTVQVNDGIGTATRSLSITIGAPLTISTTSLPNGYINIAYSQTLIAAGGSGSYSWSLASGSLPTGLSLSSAGVISGTPTAAGTYTFTVQVSDGISTKTQSLSITVTSAIGIGPIIWV